MIVACVKLTKTNQHNASYDCCSEVCICTVLLYLLMVYVDSSLHPWDETNFVMVYDRPNVVEVFKVFLGIFVSVFIRDIGL